MDTTQAMLLTQIPMTAAMVFGAIEFVKLRRTMEELLRELTIREVRK